MPAMGRRALMIVLTGCLVCARRGEGAEPAEAARTKTVAPGARYQAGWLYKFFLGEHWREAWTTPIEVPVLDLEKFDGGLRPLIVSAEACRRRTCISKAPTGAPGRSDPSTRIQRAYSTPPPENH